MRRYDGCVDIANARLTVHLHAAIVAKRTAAI